MKTKDFEQAINDINAEILRFSYDTKKEVMLRYVVGMAQGMGLECVAEGVETLEQIKLLMDCKCDIVQGFYFDRPMPVDEFVTRLDNYKYEIK